MDLTLLRVAPSAVVAMDAEGRVTTLNPAAERLFGVAVDAAIGRTYEEVFGRSLAHRIVGLFLHAARAKEPGTAHVVEATLPSGRRARLRATAGPLHGRDGRLEGVIFIAEDHSAEAAATAQVQERAAREEHLRSALRRYVGEGVAKLVDERPSFIGVGGERMVVSVLHADVRGYTTVAETMDPEKLTSLLLRYHGAAFAALQSEGATVDRFVGDAVLALWNAPRPQGEHPRMAIRGALAFRDAVVGVGSELGYGIGVHTGEAIVGNLGSERYMHYTALGDTVNVAARLQSNAQAGEVVCSAAALEAAGAGVRAASLGALTVKGRKSPVEAYRVEGIE